MWAYPGTVQIFWVPLLSRERVKLRTSNLAGTFTGPIWIKAHKNFGEKGARAYPAAVQILWEYPLISQERVKLRTSNFVGTFIGSTVDQNKSPWKILGIVAVGVVRESRKFSGHPCTYRAHCAVIFAIAQLSHEVPHWLYISKFTRLRAVSRRQHGSFLISLNAWCSYVNNSVNHPVVCICTAATVRGAVSKLQTLMTCIKNKKYENRKWDYKNTLVFLQL